MIDMSHNVAPWVPPRPAIIRPAMEIAMPMVGTFAAASLRGLRGKSASLIVDSWSYHSGTSAVDMARVTSIKLQGWNGSSWVDIDTIATSFSTNTTYSRSAPGNFTNSTVYLDYRVLWALTGTNVNSFCREITINVGVTNIVSGLTTLTTNVAGGAYTASVLNPGMVNGNTADTPWTDLTDCGTTAPWIEFNI